MKAKKSYDNGGKVKPKTSKSSRSNPNLAGRPTTPEERRKAAIEKRKAMIQRMSKTELRDQGMLRKPRSMEDGGKMKKGGRMGLPKDISGMGRFGKKLKKLKPIGAKKIDSGVSMDKTLKNSSAKIPVPAKKKRRLRRK